MCCFVLYNFVCVICLLTVAFTLFYEKKILVVVNSLRDKIMSVFIKEENMNTKQMNGGYKSLRKIGIAAAIFLVGSFSFASEKNLTRAEAALQIAESLAIQHTNDPEKLYGLAYGIFPGDYDGKNDVSNYDKPMTKEIAVVTLVRHSGWNTVQYSKTIAKKVEKYVSPEGFPHYQPDPTPRSIPYITVAYEKGLISDSDLPDLTKPCGKAEIKRLIEKYKEITQEKQSDVLLVPKSSAKEAKNGKADFVIMDNSIGEDESLYSGEDIVFDMRSAGLRLYRGKTGVSGWRQNYFPLGALDSLFSVGIEVPSDSYSHQSEAGYFTLNNYSTTVNGVALWGEATSKADGSRVWGGFITARNFDAENDAQLVGLEIDVSNYGKPGIFPNDSKVGAQIVALGDFECTNAIELIAAGKSSWHNGILVSEGTINKDGAIIGVSQSSPVATGIDFGNTPFTNAAIQVSNDSKIVMKTPSGNPTCIYSDKFNFLAVQAGTEGFRITNNENNQNLLVINPDGSVREDCLFYKKIIENNSIKVVPDRKLTIICLTLIAILFIIVIVLAVLLSAQSKIIRNMKTEEN